MSRWLFPALIFVVAFALRLAPINRYVTPDEPAWVYRSFRFSQALADGDLAAIPTTGHPGVTTMWLGSLGLQIHRWLAPDQAADHLNWLDGLAGLSPNSPAAFRHLAFFLPASRLLSALVNSLGLVVVFLLIGRLWGRAVAVVATLLLALDPFLAGHSGLLHLDGLLATTMVLSALTMLLAVYSFRPLSSKMRDASVPPTPQVKTSEGPMPYLWTAISGVLAGLALLTKTPGGLLAPFMGFLLIDAWLTRRIFWRQAFIVLALWSLAASLTFLILYPALWTDPVAVLQGMFDVGERHVEGALRPTFFHGQVTFEPGASFYLVVWFFRASPLVVIGLPVALSVYLRRRDERRFAVIALVVMALIFGLLVTFAGKKHDRYLLPAFLPLTIVAALGWDEIRRFVSGKIGVRKAGADPWIASPKKHQELYSSLVPVIVILVQFLLFMPYLFAPLGYFNPLLGGPRAASDWLEVGWGEGLGAAARWLNQDPNAERLIVAATSIPPFASIFIGQTVPLDRQTLYQADYIVHPLRQGLEGLPDEREPYVTVYVKEIGGINHASVLRNPALDEQVAYLNDHARSGDLILLDADAALAHLYDGPAELAALANASDPAEVAARLNTLIPGRESLWYVAIPGASPITARHIQEQLACYGQIVSSEAVAGTTISAINRENPHPCDKTPHRDIQRLARFDDTLGLVDAYLPQEPIAWPDQLPILVRWEALASPPADYRADLRLKDEAGRILASGGQEILDADYRRPSAWSRGHWSDQSFWLALPPGTPPGRYTVELAVFDPVSGRTLGAWNTAEAFTGLAVDLGQVTIAPPPIPPSAWDVAIAERWASPLIAGPLILLGHNPPPVQIASGDHSSFDLFWQAAVSPDVELSLRWRLVSVEEVVTSEEVLPLSPYPTQRWRASELEQVRYELPIWPDLPAGDYNLEINVLDADDTPIWPEDLILTEVEIIARDRLFSLPTDIAYPLEFKLGETVHLRGFDLEGLSAQAGGRLALTLYWQADGPTDLSYMVFVHLVGLDGMLYGQVDRLPANGGAPTQTWAPGQVVIDEIALPVLPDTPPGTYHIAVGLYDPNSGDRLPVYDPAGVELADEQIVLPLEVTVE